MVYSMLMFTPTLPRRTLLCLLVFAAGCAVLEQANSEGWNSAPTHKPLPPYYLVSDDVQGVCARTYPPGFVMNGCFRRDYASALCLITTGQNPPAWLRAHEEKHCAGFDHPAPIAIPFIAFWR